VKFATYWPTAAVAATVIRFMDAAVVTEFANVQRGCRWGAFILQVKWSRLGGGACGGPQLARMGK